MLNSPHHCSAPQYVQESAASEVPPSTPDFPREGTGRSTPPELSSECDPCPCSEHRSAENREMEYNEKMVLRHFCGAWNKEYLVQDSQLFFFLLKFALSEFLSDCLLVCLSVWMAGCLFLNLSVYHSVCLPITFLSPLLSCRTHSGIHRISL